jgi:hypothetical protein
MGYSTYFQLETSDEGEYTECPTCGNKVVIDHRYGIRKYLDDYDPFEEQTRWYEWREDMTKYSKLHPDVLFTVSGEGEESGDIWKAYIKNGQIQEETAKIQIAAFDPDKLEYP